MVVNICKAVNHSGTSSRYSDKKVEADKASVIYASHIFDTRCPETTFRIYENGSLRCERMSFHASVNPSVNDKMSDEQIVSMIKDLMFGLGYGSQPYIVYKHEDIERHHYHIVSVRVDENGRKINDSKEYVRCAAILSVLARKYGFVVGKKKMSQQNKPAIQARPDVFKGYDPRIGNVAGQMRHIAHYAMKYRFTSEQQFRSLLRSFNVDVRYGWKGNENYMVLTGIDYKTGNLSSKPVVIKDSDLSVDSVRERAAEYARDSTESNMIQTQKTIKSLLPISVSESHFMRLLALKGIIVHLIKDDNGKIVDAIFIDHLSKSCMGLESIKGLNADMIDSMSRTQWKIGAAEEYDTPDRQKGNSNYTDLAVASLGAEQSRRHEDEEIMQRGRKGPR